MKVLSFLIALIAITTLELQAINPCLCEYFQAKFRNQSYVDSLFARGEIWNPEIVKVDTCYENQYGSKRDKFGKESVFIKKGFISFHFNPFNSSTFSVNQSITANDIDSINFPSTKNAIIKYLTLAVSSTITPKTESLDTSSGTFTNNRYRFKIQFEDYIETDTLFIIEKLLDSVYYSKSAFDYYYVGGVTSAKEEFEELNYKIDNKQLSLSEILDEVKIIDLQGRTINFKFVDNIDLQVIKEKFYIIIARKGDKYFKTKLILE